MGKTLDFFKEGSIVEKALEIRGSMMTRDKTGKVEILIPQGVGKLFSTGKQSSAEAAAEILKNKGFLE